MALEIERKFTVKPGEWQNIKGTKYYQGYLYHSATRQVRVRLVGNQGFLAIKSIISQLSRNEFEYPIPYEDAEQLLKLCGNLIEKVRREIVIGGMTWEVDEFYGENQGLIIAEIELSQEDQVISLPNWIDYEVTHDGRYSNARLYENPFLNW